MHFSGNIFITHYGVPIHACKSVVCHAYACVYMSEAPHISIGVYNNRILNKYMFISLLTCKYVRLSYAIVVLLFLQFTMTLSDLNNAKKFYIFYTRIEHISAIYIYIYVFVYLHVLNVNRDHRTIEGLR